MSNRFCRHCSVVITELTVEATVDVTLVGNLVVVVAKGMIEDLAVVVVVVGIVAIVVEAVVV